jgi:zinc-ribbon domain
MRLRRLRGFGCLGCLPFGGLIGLLLPLIVIGAVIYFLMNRQKANPAPPGYPPPTNPSGGFCPHCGKPTVAGSRFCLGCGRQVDQA